MPIIQKGSDDALTLLRAIEVKCAKRQQIPYQKFETVFDFSDPIAWDEDMSLFYLLGCQRYQGSQTLQNPLSQCKRGALRIVEILANYGQNCTLGYEAHGVESISATIEAYQIDPLLAQPIATIVPKWDKRMKPWDYTVFVSGKSNTKNFTKICIQPIPLKNPKTAIVCLGNSPRTTTAKTRTK